jgi:hypothetical protein
MEGMVHPTQIRIPYLALIITPIHSKYIEVLTRPGINQPLGHLNLRKPFLLLLLRPKPPTE